MEAEAAKAAATLVQYGVVGVILILALIAIVFLDRDRTVLRKELKAESDARISDAKAFAEILIRSQEKLGENVHKMAAVVEALRERDRRG